MINGQPYPPPRVIAVDIDGTLLNNGILNQPLVEWCNKKKQDGFRLMLWSSRGLDYANRFVAHFGLDGIFDDVVSKPGYLVDDQGWRWIRYTKVVLPSILM